MPTLDYFFTVRLEDQTSSLLTKHFDLLRDATLQAQQRRPFDIVSAVVLPNRIHTIWRLPEHDCDYAKRWKMIKTTFARRLPVAAQMKVRDSGKWLWQRRFWEQHITSQTQMEECLAMIAQSPVRAGLTLNANRWRYATDAFSPLQIARAS